MSFAPLRSRHHAEHAPYDPAHRPARPEEDTVEGQAFYLEDIDTKVLPGGWHMDEHGYLQLTDTRTPTTGKSKLDV